MQKKLKRIRADELLVLNKLCESRNQAKTLIMAGQVRMGTERIDKSSRMLPQNAVLTILESLKYVGRGGLKMENFLKRIRFPGKRYAYFGYWSIHGRLYGLPSPRRCFSCNLY